MTSAESELVQHLASMGIRRLRSSDLLAESEYTQRELAELSQRGDYESPYATYVIKRGQVLKAELDRRATFLKAGEKVSPSIPLDFILRIKQAVAIQDVFNDLLGILCRGNGRRLTYACPAHLDKHPSGMLYLDDQRYYCFQCGAHGDVFDALMAFRGMTFVQAVNAMAGYLGVSLPIPKPPRNGCVPL